MGACLSGAYLPRPEKEKISEIGSNSRLSYGVSSMQGWRSKQEDAHNCMLDFDENTSLFGVYDGHGGFEVAKYTSNNFPSFLRNHEKYKAQDYETALKEAFLGFDDTITTPDVMAVLQEMVKADKKADKQAKSKCEESEELVVESSSQAGCSSRSDECDQDFETPESLRADANKPIEEVIASYRVPNHINKLKFEASKPASPYLRGRRGLNNGAAGASSAGCSSSTSASTTADAVADSEPASNEDKSEDSKSRVIPIEKADKDITPESLPEAGKSDSPALVNGAVNGGVSEGGESIGKRSKRISASSPSSENSTVTVTPGTSPKKTKKLALDDLDDSVVVKNFITNDEIAEDDEEDSDDETFQPTDEPLDSDDDGEGDDVQDYKRTLAKHFLKCFDKAVRKSYDYGENEEEEEDDDSEDESNEEENSSTQSDDETEEVDESVDEEHENENSDEEPAEDSDEDEDDMACKEKPDRGPGIDSGCTAVVALLKGRDLYVANAGDSRCIVCQNGKAVDMSEDHKPEDELEHARIKKAGGHVTMDGRVDGGLNLSRAIGDHCYKQKTDLPNTEQMVTALPDVRYMKLEPDVEFLVLACDGIWNSYTSQEVVDFVRPKILEKMSLSKICEELFDKCLAPNTWGDGTGCDNMTCIIVKPSHADDETPPVESNATEEKTDSETNEVVGAAGDASACAPKKCETSTAENGVAETDDTTKKSEEVSANGDRQPGSSQLSEDSTTTTTTTVSQSKVQKRCADEMVAGDDHQKRQKTDDTKVELS